MLWNVVKLLLYTDGSLSYSGSLVLGNLALAGVAVVGLAAASGIGYCRGLAAVGAIIPALLATIRFI